MGFPPVGFRGAFGLLLRAAFVTGFLLCAVGFVYFAYCIVADKRRTFVIGREGVVAYGKLTPWSRIRWFAAYGGADDKTVTMFFKTAGLGQPQDLPTTPPLTCQQYEQLISVLRREIAPLYPDIRLGGYFAESS